MSTQINNKLTIHLDKKYTTFLEEAKKQLQQAQIEATVTLNREAIKFYWQLGRGIIKLQEETYWGSKLLEQLSKDLQTSNPGMSGFSKRNLEYMRLLAKIYPEQSEFTQQPAAQLPWTQIQLLLDKFKDDQAQLTWYAKESIKHSWSRSVLSMQIKTNLYDRQSISESKTSNYRERLPSPQSDMAHEMLKNPYSFDFLTISQEARELEIEKELIAHIKNFLLELGSGFAFIGNQVPVTVDGEEFFIDALFYHYKLKSFVVIELKAKKFKPADLGQLSFYLEAVDRHFREKDDNPTIGILLCESRSKIIAEYALNKINAPIGVSEYELTTSLPKKYQNVMPSVEELEAKLSDSKK